MSWTAGPPPPQRSCNLVREKDPHLISEEQQQETLCSPTPHDQNPEGEDDVFAFQSLTTPVPKTAPFREERFTLTQYGAGFGEWYIRFICTKPGHLWDHWHVPMACGIDFTFLCISKAQKRNNGLVTPKVLFPKNWSCLGPYHVLPQLAVWLGMCPLTSLDFRGFCFVVVVFGKGGGEASWFRGVVLFLFLSPKLET